MQNIKVISVKDLLTKQRNDLVTVLIKTNDNIKMDGPIISFKNNNLKNVFVQQQNGNWISFIRGEGYSVSSSIQTYWHGQTVYECCCDYRKDFYTGLLKEIFDDNKMKYAEIDSHIYM